MISRRLGMLLAGGLALVGTAAPGTGQVPDEVIVNIMRECAKIDDPTARLACYDNNIRSGGFDGRGPSVPGQMQAPQGSSAPNSGSGPSGFGSESVRAPERFDAPAGQVDEINARIESVAQRQPGVYLVTLEGGAQWLFSESVGRSFRPPRRGDSVKIERASLGSFLMRFDGQESVRVRRVR